MMTTSWTIPWLILTAVLLCHVESHNAILEPELGCDELVDVAIVGGGVGGAYSAYKLRDSGKTIALFEYSSRIGGRTMNYRLPNAPDVILQMGAKRFVEGIHVKFDKISQEVGLKKIVFPDGEGWPNITRFFLRGYSLSSDEVYYGKIPYALTDEESQNRHRITAFYFEKLTGYKTEDIKKNNLSFEDIFSFKVVDGTNRYLHQLSIDEALSIAASPEGKAFFVDQSKFYYVFDTDTTAVITFLPLFRKSKGGQVFTLEKGMEAFPRRLVDRFLQASKSRHTLMQNKQLTSIQKLKENMYLLSFTPTEYNRKLKKTEILSFNPPFKVCARRAILALPLFALKQVNWQPLRGDLVAEAISAFSFPTASRIYMSFKTPWWLEAHPNSTVKTVNFGDRKTSYRQMYNWHRSNVTGHYILLASYTDGHKAQYLKYLQTKGPIARGCERGEHQVSVKLKSEVLKDLFAAMDIEDETSRPEPETMAAQFWSDYPFGTGWVSSRPGYPLLDLMRVLRKPSIDDDVFVVGSDYSFGWSRGWCEGALDTVDSVMEEYFKSFQ